MRRILMLVAAGAASVAAAPASAVSITYKSWYSSVNGPDPGSAPTTYTQTDWTGVTQKILVPQFDTTLGTLTAATLTLYADANSTGSVQNQSPGSAVITTYVAAVRAHLLAPSNSTTGPGITTAATPTTPFLAEALPTLISVSNRTLAPNATLPFAVTGTNATSTIYNLFTSLPYLPFFEGNGNVTLPVYVGTKVSANVSGGNLVVTQSTTARAEAVVTYTYTPTPPVDVPEPMSIALMGAALVGLGLIRRLG